MPDQATTMKAKKDLRQGKRPSTAAGEFVREEMHHIREGKHGARSTKQAIAIGLSKARRAGVKLPAPKRGTTSARTRASARNAAAAGRSHPRRKPSRTRSRAMSAALRREPHRAASHRALARQARTSAAKRTRADRSRSARKAAQTRAQTRTRTRHGAR